MFDLSVRVDSYCMFTGNNFLNKNEETQKMKTIDKNVNQSAYAEPNIGINYFIKTINLATIIITICKMLCLHSYG